MPRESAQRTSFQFPPEAVAQLAAIRARSCISNDADLLRAALDAHGTLLDLVSTGHRVVVRDREGHNKTHCLFKSLAPEGAEASPGGRAKVVKAKGGSKNFFFSGPAVERLEAIKARCYLSTNAEAVRRSLAVYAKLLAIDALHEDIVIRDRLGREAIFSPHWQFVADFSDPIPASTVFAPA